MVRWAAVMLLESAPLRRFGPAFLERDRVETNELYGLDFGHGCNSQDVEAVLRLTDADTRPARLASKRIHARRERREHG